MHIVKICYYFVNYIGFNMDNSITNDDLNNLENRLAVFNEYIYQNKANLINEYHSLLDEEFVSLENGIQLKTNWLTQNHPILEESLYKLQYSLQEKNVNFFSELMSTLTREILENDKTIKMCILKILSEIEKELPNEHTYFNLVKAKIMREVNPIESNSLITSTINKLNQKIRKEYLLENELIHL